MDIPPEKKEGFFRKTMISGRAKPEKESFAPKKGKGKIILL